MRSAAPMISGNIGTLRRGSPQARTVLARAALVNGNAASTEPVLQPRRNSESAQDCVGKQVEERGMMRCILKHERNAECNVDPNWSYPQDKLDEAYDKCADITEHYAKTFFLGTQLMTPEKARAVWAIYVWCRRTDELVDGPNADRITPEALDRWEERLEQLFDGRPCDNLDAALTDTVNRFPVDIQPFRDMIDGMRTDIAKTRYYTYDELYEYCYRVAGTVALMVMPVMGMDMNYKGKLEPVYRAALSLGVANQLTNILRDVGEDLRERNRVYIPLDELAKFNITEEELLAGMHCTTTGKMDDRYVHFMKHMIERTMGYYQTAEPGIAGLNASARWPVWSALIVYRKILDAIQENEYDNITKRAYVSRGRKLMLLPFAFACSLLPSKHASAVSRLVPF